MIRFNCTNCRKALKASKDSVGKRTECPRCHRKLEVPPPTGNQIVPQDAVLFEFNDTGALPDAEQLRKKPTRHRTDRILPVVLTIVCLPLFFIALTVSNVARATLNHEKREEGYMERGLSNPNLRQSTVYKISAEDRLARRFSHWRLGSVGWAFLAVLFNFVLLLTSAVNGYVSLRTWRVTNDRVMFATFVVGGLGVLIVLPGSCCCLIL